MSRASEELFLGWLDLGEEDQRRARDYLAQFEADNTLDELGFGNLRDAFADVFFPATSTVMTRARYLVFIPALCLAVENERLFGRAARRRLTDLENELREAFPKEEEGVIGRVSKDSLKRYPSSIYWGALRRLGIFLHANRGLAYYQDHLQSFYEATTPEKDDDNLSHLSSQGLGNWDRQLIGIIEAGNSLEIKKRMLPKSVTFSLTRAEAKYLAAKLRAMDQEQDRTSLLAHLLDIRHPTPFDYPWEVSPPPGLSRHVEHARCLSMMARGATLQYFYLLIRERTKQRVDQPDFDMGAAFSAWWAQTRNDLGEWDLDEFSAVAKGIDGLRRHSDDTFIREWLALHRRARGAKAMLENTSAHDLIRRREKSVRPNKSRLHHAEYLRRWNAPTQDQIDAMPLFGIDYRARIGSRFVRDIVQGLKGVR